MRGTASNLTEYLESRMWAWPIAALLSALVAAIVTLTIDTRVARPLGLGLVTSDPETARSILSVICGALVNLLVFTFTMAMVVIQLASSQYSPRLMRALLRDRPTKASLALFVATFTYAAAVLHSVSTVSTRPFVPELSLFSTYALVVASLLGFLMFINHVVQSVRVGSIISRIAGETYALIEQVRGRVDSLTARPQPRATGIGGATTTIHCGERSGSLNFIDEDGLIELARERGVVIEMLRRVGDYVPYGAPIARVGGGPVDARVFDHLHFGHERTLQQDIGYGLRQLVDVAIRALSPSLNDPTTAVQSIDRIHEILRRLIELPDMPAALADADGQLRLVLVRSQWPDYVAVALTEIRVYGAESPQVTRRLEAMLRDLCEAAPAERRPALEQQLAALESRIDQHIDGGAERALSRGADQQGLGAPSPAQ